MKKYLATLSAALLAFGLSAEALKPEWTGNKGQAAEPPEIAKIASLESDDEPKEGEEAIGVLATVVVEGNYQGILGTFAKPINLSKYRGIAFDIRQSCYHSEGTFVVAIGSSSKTIHHVAMFGAPDEWKHIEIAFDDPEWQGGKVGTLKMRKVSFYCFAELNKVDETLAIANLTLLEK